MNGFVILAVALFGAIGGGVCWLGWQLLRQNGRMLLRLDELEKRLDAIEFGEPAPEGLAPGSIAPGFDLPDLTGRHHALAEYRDQPVLLIFFNPACGFCREMAPKLSALYGVRPQTESDAAPGSQPSSADLSQSAVAAVAVQSGTDPSFDGRLAPLIITTGDPEQNRQLLGATNLTVLVQEGMEVGTAYQAFGTPTGYLVNAEGKIASPMTVGADALLALAAGKAGMDEGPPAPGAAPDEKDRESRFSSRSLAKSKIKRDGLKAGTTAPGFHLPRVDGRGELSLEELRGRRVVLVFSDPHCGPCSALAPKLEQFHRQHPEIEFVMVSRGDPKENRAKIKEHGLTFPVVLQRQWEVSRLYAMFATPIAYLVGKNGFLEADVAVGVDAIAVLMSKAVEAGQGVNAG